MIKYHKLMIVILLVLFIPVFISCVAELDDYEEGLPEKAEYSATGTSDTDFGENSGYSTADFANNAVISSMVLDTDENIYVAVNVSGSGILVKKYDQNGSDTLSTYPLSGTPLNNSALYNLVPQAAGTGTPVIKDIAIDSEGNIVVVGICYGSGDQEDGFIIKLFPSLEPFTNFGSAGSGVLVTDYNSTNNRFNAVSTQGTNIFTAGAADNNGKGAIWAFDVVGNGFNPSTPDPEWGNLTEMFMDSHVLGNNIYLTGTTGNAGSTQVIFRTISTTLNSWDRFNTFAFGTNQISYGIAVSNTAQVYISGHLNTGGDDEMFVWYLDPDEITARTYTTSTNSPSRAHSLFIDNLSRVVVGGYTTGSRMTLWRLHWSGGNFELDTSFGNSGVVLDNTVGIPSVGYSIQMNYGGKILIGGNATFGNLDTVVWRYK
jgi:hypothetical protein